MKENLYTPNCIRTYSGKYLNVFDPNPNDIVIGDIAWALSNIPRFGGHLPIFYSVAQHSLACTEIVPKEYKLSALMHDASEAYLLDMPKPIKNLLPDYIKVEDNLMKIIAEKFAFEYPKPECVERADVTMLELEWDEIMLKNNVGRYVANKEFIFNSFMDAFKKYKKTNGNT